MATFIAPVIALANVGLTLDAVNNIQDRDVTFTDRMSGPYADGFYALNIATLTAAVYFFVNFASFYYYKKDKEMAAGYSKGFVRAMSLFWWFLLLGMVLSVFLAAFNIETIVDLEARDIREETELFNGLGYSTLGFFVLALGSYGYSWIEKQK